MSDISDPVVYEIVAARIRLLFEQPFFGQLAARLDLVDATDWCSTAATDGRTLYYNREFIKSLSQDELLFLIGHELLHVVYDHVGRCGWRDPKLHNMATDYLVNWTLVDSKVGKMPSSGLYDIRFNDTMTSEDTYELLKAESVTIKMPLDHHLEMRGAGEGDGDGEGDGEGENGDGREIEVTVMGKNGPPKLTNADVEKIRNEVRAAVIQAAQQGGIGSVPAGIRRLINDLVTPQMDWRTLLDAHVRSSFKDDYSFQTVNRRSWGSGFIFPGQNYENQIKIAVGIDTSGSMTPEMMRDFLSEIHGIVAAFKAYEIMVFTWDTETYNPKIFTPMNINELLEYVPQGGGGTMSSCAFEMLKREDYMPERLIMMTDGYIGGDWGDPNYCDTLWIIHSNPQKNIQAPFGITTFYEEKAAKKKAA